MGRPVGDGSVGLGSNGFFKTVLVLMSSLELRFNTFLHYAAPLRKSQGFLDGLREFQRDSVSHVAIAGILFDCWPVSAW
jgi:hypothetical protein